MLGQLVDRIAAIQQDALVAVDEGDVALAARGRGEPRIVGEHVRLAVQLADVQDLRSLGAAEGRQLVGLVLVGQRGRADGLDLALSHGRLLERPPGEGGRAISQCSNYKPGPLTASPLLLGNRAVLFALTPQKPSTGQGIHPGPTPPWRRTKAAMKPCQ